MPNAKVLGGTQQTRCTYAETISIFVYLAKEHDSNRIRDENHSSANGCSGYHADETYRESTTIWIDSERKRDRTVSDREIVTHGDIR